MSKFSLNTSKTELQKALKICLSKQGYADDTEAKVNLIVDGSYSMGNLYQNGTVKALIQRALVIGEKFDDDGAIDVFDFADGDRHRMHEQATQESFDTYNISILGGGTAYAPVVKRMTDFYYKEEKGSKGFLGLFKKKAKAAEGRDGMDDKHPVFSIFITDGETLQRDEDQRVLDKILKKHPDMFIQFVGIGRESFSFLRQMEKAHKNAGFTHVSNLSSLTDEELLRSILSEKAKNVLNK